MSKLVYPAKLPTGSSRKARFLRKLCKSIRNPDKEWNFLFPHTCIMGHISSVSGKACNYSASTQTYERETGDECRLDFLGRRLPTDSSFREVTREGAVRHILGISKTWPQLT